MTPFFLAVHHLIIATSSHDAKVKIVDLKAGKIVHSEFTPDESDLLLLLNSNSPSFQRLSHVSLLHLMKTEVLSRDMTRGDY